MLDEAPEVEARSLFEYWGEYWPEALQESIYALFSAGGSRGAWCMARTRKCSFHRTGKRGKRCSWIGPT